MAQTHLICAMQDSDSAGIKIQGAVINATIFVVFVGLMTFALVLLFKYGVNLSLEPYFVGLLSDSTSLTTEHPQYSNIIWGYMGFAGFSIFFVLGGTLTTQLIQLYHIPIDIISFFIPPVQHLGALALPPGLLNRHMASHDQPAWPDLVQALACLGHGYV